MKKLFAFALSLCLILSAVGAFADSIVFGTAATSGTYYQVGAAIGTAISNSGVQVNVIPTAGSNENVSMAQTGDIDIGMGNSDAIYGAYNGELTYANAGKQAIQEVAALYYSQMHIYTRDGSLPRAVYAGGTGPAQAGFRAGVRPGQGPPAAHPGTDP